MNESVEGWQLAAAAALCGGAAGYLFATMRRNEALHDLKAWWSGHASALVLDLVEVVQDRDFESAAIIAEALDIAYGRAVLCHQAIENPAPSIEVVG